MAGEGRQSRRREQRRHRQRSCCVHGSARFSARGQKPWTSHWAWARFRLHGSGERVICIGTYTQLPKGNTSGNFKQDGVKPWFNRKEWARMQAEALKILTSPEPQYADSDEKVNVQIVDEQMLPHKMALCQRCHKVRQPCSGSLLIDVDGNVYAHVPRKARKMRLRAGERLTLYHQTDEESAQAILSTQSFRRGKRGIAGGGIYFATSAADTERKAKKHGVTLQCTVTLGKIKILPANGDPKLTAESLLNEGFDSVKILRERGEEYVVYFSDQVRDIQRVIE